VTNFICISAKCHVILREKGWECEQRLLDLTAANPAAMCALVLPPLFGIAYVLVDKEKQEKRGKRLSLNILSRLSGQSQ
jgi:hypothetical protein